MNSAPDLDLDLDRELAARVRLCVPLRHPAFGALLRLLSVEASESVTTAAVTVGARSRLLVNPQFVAQHCRTDEHLAMLVLHELYHVLLGHTRLFRRPTLAANWAFDCIVNAQLCRLHPDQAYASFFAAAAAPAGPWSLIGPPPGWPEAPRYADGALGEVHRRLYDGPADGHGSTTAELFELLTTLAVELDPEGAGSLLGNHGGSADGDGPETAEDPLARDPELMAEVRRIVARWPLVERVHGADDGASPVWQRHGLRRQQAAVRALEALLRRAAAGDASGPLRRQPSRVPAMLPLPQPGDRRAQLQRLLGGQPLLWSGTVQHEGPAAQGRATVYLDVSGSMQPWLPVLLQALLRAGESVRWPVLGFSTEVHALTREDLAQGRVRTTGGTHIGCVAEHLLQHRVARAVVITDGDVQRLGSVALTRLRRRAPRVVAGLVDGGPDAFCAAPGWAAVRLPPLERSAR